MTAGWRVAGACAAALPVVLVLVVWRAAHLDGGWLVALQVAAAVAVTGLAAGCWLAVLHATRFPAARERRELVLRVEPGQDGPTTSVVPPPVDETPLRRAVGVALAASVPLLLVLLLVPGQETSPDTAAAAAGSTSTVSASTAGESPSATATPAQPSSQPSPPATAPPAPSPQPPSPPPPSPAPEEPAPRECQVVVAAGDTLWDIAAQRLGAGATDAEIDAAWRADYAANAVVVGPDPDLILPGQVLVVPCASG